MLLQQAIQRTELSPHVFWTLSRKILAWDTHTTGIIEELRRLSCFPSLFFFFLAQTLNRNRKTPQLRNVGVYVPTGLSTVVFDQHLFFNSRYVTLVAFSVHHRSMGDRPAQSKTAIFSHVSFTASAVLSPHVTEKTDRDTGGAKIPAWF